MQFIAGDLAGFLNTHPLMLRWYDQLLPINRSDTRFKRCGPFGASQGGASK